MIKKYQKRLSRKKYGSNRYLKIQKTYWKWIDKKNNKIRDAYHKLSHNLTKLYDVICMEDLNIKRNVSRHYSKQQTTKNRIGITSGKNTVQSGLVR